MMIFLKSGVCEFTMWCIKKPRTSPMNFPVSDASGDTITYPLSSRTKHSKPSVMQLTHGLSPQVLVMFLNNVCIAECWNWKPTTAAGADFPFSLWKTAWVAVTKVSFRNSGSNGTAYTKLLGSTKCCSTARRYQISPIAFLLVSLNSFLKEEKCFKLLSSENLKYFLTRA